VYSQGAHQIDMLRLIGGGLVTSVTARTGAWDPARPTEGAYAALLAFADGAFASATYSGYGHFDSDVLMGGIDEQGNRKPEGRYGAARRALAASSDPHTEAALKNARNYGGAAYVPAPPASGFQYHHFGFLVASCDRADLRPLPSGVMIHADEAERLESLPPPQAPRAEVIDELYAAVADGTPPLHSGEWARATLEVCLAVLTSAEENGRPVPLRLQVPAEEPAR
jgi:phthalate 4,5-cis-dihydrodiol dehydrogenase